MKILVIEDDWDILYLVSKTIEQMGYSVDVASTITNAEYLILKNNYELVVSDVMLPHLGGFELVNLIKMKNDIPVILLTGMDKDIMNTTITKADAILSKPYNGKELLAIIEEKLNQYYPKSA
jgi:two-component system OmpR family response regulator